MIHHVTALGVQKTKPLKAGMTRKVSREGAELKEGEERGWKRLETLCLHFRVASENGFGSTVGWQIHF